MATQQVPVLNVNDDDATLYLTTQILRSGGFLVLEARTGGEALQLAETRMPALVILDIGLPDMSGIEVRRRLRANPRTSQLKILHTSAALGVFGSHPDTRILGDADGFLQQPFEPGELLERVRALVGGGTAQSMIAAPN